MVEKVANNVQQIDKSLKKTLNVFLARKKMNKQIRKNRVDQALALLKVDGIEISDYCKSQINEYINGRMTHKMLLQMLDEWYLTEVVKERLDNETVKVDINEI